MLALDRSCRLLKGFPHASHVSRDTCNHRHVDKEGEERIHIYIYTYTSIYTYLYTYVIRIHIYVYVPICT